MDDRYAPGLPDDAYERADGVPMTKREVRAVTMAYARLPRDASVLDVGAGTGGLTADLARVCARGRVTAIERDSKALPVLRANVERLAPGNVQIIAEEAPQAFSLLRGVRFDAAVVGGHGGKLAEILAALPEHLVPGGRVVVNAVGLSAAKVAFEALSRAPYRAPEMAQVAVSRAAPLGGDVRLVPLNPVFVITAKVEEA